MSRWFRYYDDALNDPKVQLLPDKPINYFKCWINLLSVASKNGGSLVSVGTVAYALRMAPEKAAAVVTFLSGRGLLDRVEGAYFEPHNWGTRQFQSDVSTSRVQKLRKQRKKQERNVSETADETPPETEQITEQKPSLRSGDISPSTPSLSDSSFKDRELVECARVQKPCQFQREFDDWYARYPHKVGKQAAMKAFEKVRKSGVPLDQLTSGLARYSSKTDDRPWCNPATFLNEGRYDDQPAASNGHSNAPRPGSWADRAERSHDAYRKLSEYVESHSDVPSGSSSPSQETAPVLRLTGGS